MQPLEKGSHIANILNAVFGFLCVIIGSVTLWLQLQQRPTAGGMTIPRLMTILLSVLIVIGFAMLFMALSRIKHKPLVIADAAPVVPAQSPMAQKQEMSGGQANITQHFNWPATEPPRPQPEPRKPPREPRYNFVFSDIDVVFVAEEREGYSRVEQPQYARSAFIRPLAALSIEVTNRPHDEFTPDYASDVVAGLTIDGGPHISPIIWLDNNRGEIDFSSGHPNTLLLAVADDRHSDRWNIPRYKLRTTESGYRVVSLDYGFPLGKHLEVTIELSIKGRIVKKIPLEVSWPEGKICMVARHNKQ